MNAQNEYRLIKFLTNENHSPVENYLERNSLKPRIDLDSACSGKYKVTDEARRWVFTCAPDKQESSDTCDVLPFFTFGSYNLALVYPHWKKFNLRDLSFVPQSGHSREVAGDIAVSAHGVALFKFKDYKGENTTLGSDNDTQSGELSHRPFLAFLAVVVSSEFYSCKPDHEINHTKIAEDLAAAVEKAVVATKSKDDTTFECFYSLHTADFVVMLRCANPQTAYSVSLALSSDTSYYDVHTIMSYEMGYYMNDAKFCYKRPQYSLDKTNLNFSFRVNFSATSSFQQKLSKVCDSITVQTGQGALLGYFDICVNLSYEQFCCIYPAICEDKLFRDDAGFDWDNNIKDFEPKCASSNKCANCISNLIGKEISKSINSVNDGSDEYCYRRIASLNIDLLGDLKFPQPESDERNNAGANNASKHHLERIKLVKSLTAEMIVRITKLREYRIFMTKMKPLYTSSLGLLLDLVKVYMPMGEQADLYLNWCVVNNYIENLVVGIERAVYELKHLVTSEDAVAEDAPDNNERAAALSLQIVEITKRGVDAINTFARLTMGVNLQFISAATYELLTQTNAQKSLCAYHEFGHELSENYANQGKASSGGGNRKITMLTIPHINSLQPEAQRLYPHGYVDVDENNPQNHLVTVRLPSVETFFRVYEIVPYLRHEYNHFLHLRGDCEADNYLRNKHLLHATMMEVAAEIINWFAYQSNTDISAINGTEDLLNSLKNSVCVTLESYFKRKKLNASTAEQEIGEFLFSDFKEMLKHFLYEELSVEADFDKARLTRKLGIDKFCDFLLRYVHVAAYEKKAAIERLRNCAYRVEDMSNQDDENAKCVRSYVHERFLYEEISKILDKECHKWTQEIYRLSPEKREERNSYERMRDYANKRKSLFMREYAAEEEIFLKSVSEFSSVSENSDAEPPDEPLSNSICIQARSYIDSLINFEAHSRDVSLNTLRALEQMHMWLAHTMRNTAVLKLSEIVLDYAVETAFEMYNEARSDVFMCTTMQFNTIGYLHFLARAQNRTVQSNNQESYYYRRLQLVAYALSNSCEPLNPQTRLDYEQLIRAKFNKLLDDLNERIDIKYLPAPPELFETDASSVADIYKNNVAEDYTNVNDRLDEVLCQFKKKCEEELNEAKKFYIDDCAKMFEPQLDNMFIYTRDYETNSKTEEHEPIHVLLQRVPTLRVLWEMAKCVPPINFVANERAQIDNNNSSNKEKEDARRAKVHNQKFEESLINILGYFAVQFSDIERVRTQLYRIRRLPPPLPKAIEHIRTDVANVYANRRENNCNRFNNDAINNVMDRIRNFYNGADPEKYATNYNEAAMMKDSIRFINEFYWKNRSRMATIKDDNAQ
jgi:hypothetical protein